MIRYFIRGLGPLVAAVLVAACSTVGGGPAGAGNGAATPNPDPGPSYPEIGGAWMGSLQIEGQAFNSLLEITQMGGDLRLTVEIPALELTTVGSGTVLPDGTLRVSFPYELECPGNAEYVGRVSAGATVLSGTLLASDCTGDLRGTFRYER